MAFTPYPDDARENPSVVASNDGLTWVVPSGLTNPLDPVPGDPAMVNGARYNSDTDLVHHDGTLYLIWRRFDSALGETIYLRTSTDGVTWTARQVVLHDPNAGRTIVSPSLIRDSEGIWHLWYGWGSTIQIRHRTAPSPTGPWTAHTACTIVGLETYRHVWHMDVLPWDGIYLGLFATTQAGSTNISGALFAAVSEDGLNWQVGRCLIQPTKVAPGLTPSWDGTVIYRAGGVVDGEELRLWYATAQRIGYTEVPLGEFTSALHALRL